MFIVYILKSESSGRYYIGMTSDLEDRLRRHNRGDTTSTRNRGPWHVVWTEPFVKKTDAWKREQQIKSYKGGEAFKQLLH
ncbi:GIY-YIG nuclease family protein, partial [Candidatus Uhrbacteria bacterium]|nr:GIY-YIG nuclease family protein [Candidatus Uhrbacteria bacterium]